MADDFVETLLRSWDLPDLIESFKNEGIDEESFRLLDSDTIAFLINKAGPRLKFKNKFKQYSVENWCNDTSRTLTPSTLNDSISSASLEETQSLHLDNQSGDIYNYMVDENNQLLSTSFMLMPPPAVPPATNILLADIGHCQINVDDANPNPQTKKLRTSIFPTSLEKFLNDSVDGRLILGKKGAGLLDNCLRNKLASLIISHLVNDAADINKGVSPCILACAAEEIVELFPNELKETYYIPYKPKTGIHKKIAPRGKLYSKYVNIHAAINSNNKGVNNTGDNINLSPSSSTNIRIVDEETKTALEFLKASLQPLSEIRHFWNITFQARQEHAKRLSIDQYLDLYPALKQNEGVLLFEEDFKQLFPGKERLASENWPKIAEAIQLEFHKRKLKIPIELSDNINVELRSLFYLPYLFPPVTIANKKKKKNWRPSKLEVQESFFLHISNVGLLEEKIEERKANLLAANCTLQPFIACTGNIKENGLEYYIIVNDVKFQVNSALEALDLTFKFFHATGACYPPESTHVWMFIQRLVYDIRLREEDHISSATSALISDIKKNLKESGG